jgi:hypothetical protein
MRHFFSTRHKFTPSNSVLDSHALIHRRVKARKEDKRIGQHCKEWYKHFVRAFMIPLVLQLVMSPDLTSSCHLTFPCLSLSIPALISHSYVFDISVSHWNEPFSLENA